MSIIAPEREETEAPPVDHPWDDPAYRERDNLPPTEVCHILGKGAARWISASPLCGVLCGVGVEKDAVRDVGAHCLFCGKRRCPRCWEIAFG